MKKYGVNEIREMYLSFFQSKEHLRAKSFSLVPQGDKSLLLINAGMAPLKAYFTGQEIPPSKRMTTCQKCIRTGDIENVGKTARHGTFFEMLGNFSFGDYFKEEAIEWAWEFVTKVLEIPSEKLYISVYEEDEETAQIWQNKMGIPKDKIVYMGKEDNFWEVGTVGPCGPCTEIYYDRGEKYGCGSSDCKVGCDCDRYLEFWNLVFTQFDKNEDGSYTPLPNPNIDTGMGLERIAAMMQDVNSIFDVDTIKAIRDHVCEISGVEYGKDPKKDISIRVITDHIRSVTFMAADGIRASNEGRGYVMRRLLRRAVRHGKLLGIEGLFLEPLINTVVQNSKHEYTELEEKYDYIIKSLTVEEQNFNQTIEQGLTILENYISEMESNNQKVLNKEACFKLYDTYGFPIDLTIEILEEKGFGIDEEGFKEELEAQRVRARNAQAETNYMGSEKTVFHDLDVDTNSTFKGYDSEIVESKILYLTTHDEIIDSAIVGEHIFVITEETSLYAEGGGQAGDKGFIYTPTGVFEVLNTTKVAGNKIAHYGEVLKGEISVNQEARTSLDVNNRQNTSANHSATHLLQSALRTVVGNHIEQAGSNVSAERLRFDYTHFEALTKEQLRAVEREVNELIIFGYDVTIADMTIDEARKLGAMALFGEKYGDTVRVVNMSNKSIELCGGTHVINTSQIGPFKIISETGVASGVRRIEAVTGFKALEYYQQVEDTLENVASVIKAKRVDDVLKRASQIVQENRQLQKDKESLNAKFAKLEAEQVLSNVQEIQGVKVLVSELSNMDMNMIKNLGDTLKDKLEEGVIVLASNVDKKVNLVCMATKEAVDRGINCGQVISKAVKIVDGGGGGRPNMAQAVGKDASKLQEALKMSIEIITEQLN
ncbi:MAG: alanine--tRNA ligase [Epulopiscium sp. Nele67-Bin005]|nr:MAG: alanine--tRNA ligase [Epulopiscium sp. Nele67-Bin005]